MGKWEKVLAQIVEGKNAKPYQVRQVRGIILQHRLGSDR